MTFDFCGPKVANQGFKPMVREGQYDAGELAIVTFLQAKVYGKPLILLPATVLGRFQQHTIVYNAERGPLKPGDLTGRRVGLRSYSVTTATWVRGILQHEYGVDLARVTWVCSDDGHLAEYRDPPNVERTKPGAKPFDQMLFEGEIDAAVIPDTPKDPRIRPLIADPQAAARAWYEKNKVIPINHLLAVQKPLADARPDVVKEIYRVLSGEQEGRAGCGRRHRFFPVRDRGEPQAARNDRAICVRAEDHSAKIHGRRGVRGSPENPRPLISFSRRYRSSAAAAGTARSCSGRRRSPRCRAGRTA